MTKGFTVSKQISLYLGKQISMWRGKKAMKTEFFLHFLDLFSVPDPNCKSTVCDEEIKVVM